MKPGDRVAHKYDDKVGVLIAGEGRITVQASSGTVRPSFFIKVSPGFALVQWDGQDGAQFVAEQHLAVIS